MSPDRIVPHPMLNAEAQLTRSEGAITTAGLAAVCAEVAGRHRRRIVECGSGFRMLLAGANQVRHGTHGLRFVARVFVP